MASQQEDVDEVNCGPEVRKQESPVAHRYNFGWLHLELAGIWITVFSGRGNTSNSCPSSPVILFIGLVERISEPEKKKSWICGEEVRKVLKQWVVNGPYWEKLQGGRGGLKVLGHSLRYTEHTGMLWSLLIPFISYSPRPDCRLPQVLSDDSLPTQEKVGLVRLMH